MRGQRINFVTELFAKRKLPYIYSDVHNIESNQNVFKNHREQLDLKHLLIVEDVPRYLNVQRREKPKYIRSFLVKQYPGFRIDFKDINRLSDYLNQRFGKSSRY